MRFDRYRPDADRIYRISCNGYPPSGAEDEDYDRQYDAEDRLRRISLIFAALAILIACPGLIGLAAFTAQ